MSQMRQFETYEGGGDKQYERRLFERLADDIMHAQLKNRKARKAKRVDRAFHSKGLVGTRDAELVFSSDLPEEFQAGFAQPGARYPVIVRFSNASVAADFKPDLRGIALRVEVSPTEHHDLLATNFPVSHARNARQFVAFAVATAGGPLSQVIGLAGLVFQVGPFEVFRMLANVSKGRKTSSSLAKETYWSRGAMRWGPNLAVRFLLKPANDKLVAPEPSKDDPDCLSRELTERLSKEDVVFELCLQRFTDEKATPIEDTAVEWTKKAAPHKLVAVLRLKATDPETSPAELGANAAAIESLAFNPWNTTPEFEPLGNLNRARKVAYDASAHHRLGYRWRTEPPLRNVISTQVALGAFAVLNRFIPWHRLWVPLGLLNLDIYRHVLRKKNLIDPFPHDPHPTARPVPETISEAVRVRRNYDGRYNDLSNPEMGKLGACFGRNLQPDCRPKLFDTPDPVEVSRLLLHRKSFIPARSLNILAAAWIQFQVHDWVNHARNPLGKDDIVLPVPLDREWRNRPGGPIETEMHIAGNRGRIDGGEEYLFANNASHWWDGSEVYGANDVEARKLRNGAELAMDGKDYLRRDVSGMAMTGFNESWWLGLGAMHTLFAREHNLLCRELKSHYRDWDDDRIYETARLIVSALIAKIHTVEWTPAILATKTIDAALNANWSGPPNDLFVKLGVWLLDVHSSTGIPKTKPDHHGAPYALTEDFTTVYRLHPLIPDHYSFFNHATGKKIGDKVFMDIQGSAADDVLRHEDYQLNNVLYSLGIAHPGAITLHNFPTALTNIERAGDDGKPEMIDLSVIDIVRTRRRGVPRYNDFLAGLHRPRVKRWEDLTANPDSVAILKEVYKDIDMVDTVVGLTAENPPENFGFSDTAFRIFLLMATRRIQSDRFLTVDFRPEVYSPFGMDWIAKNTMTSVILRHCPELAAVMPSDASAFAPWRRVVESGWAGPPRQPGAADAGPAPVEI